MLVKSQVKYIQSLGQKKFRDQEGAFVAEGPRIVKELLMAPNIRLLNIYAGKEWLEDPENSGWRDTATDAAVTELKKGELERISSLVTPNQVLAVFSKPVFPAPEFGKSFSLLLDSIQDPGNLGTIIRIADWFGIRQIACTPDSADAFGSKTVQSTMASIGRVQVLYEDLENLIAQHPAVPVFAATLHGKSIYGMDRVSRGMLLIGNEAKGISRELMEKVPKHITIPGTGKAESLNAAVATGIILSHLLSPGPSPH
jgi:TrmH family RNA methyltransferase